MKNNYNGKFSQTRNMKDNYFLKTSVSKLGAEEPFYGMEPTEN